MTKNQESFNKRFVSRVFAILAFTAFVFYLYGIVQIGQQSLESPNFAEVINENGEVKQEPLPPPVASAFLTLIVGVFSGYLVYNFTKVTGITPEETLTLSKDNVNHFDANTTLSTGKSTVPELILKGVSSRAVNLARFFTHFYKEITSLSPKYWGVIVYLVGSFLATYYFLADGGIGNGYVSVSQLITDLMLAFFGVLAATLKSLS